MPYWSPYKEFKVPELNIERAPRDDNGDPYWSSPDEVLVISTFEWLSQQPIPYNKVEGKFYWSPYSPPFNYTSGYPIEWSIDAIPDDDYGDPYWTKEDAANIVLVNADLYWFI